MPESIPTLDKEEFKRKLLWCINVPFNKVAVQFSVIISKIAQLDFPIEWPDLISTLLSQTQSFNELYRIRALKTIVYVLKEISSHCMTADPTIFYQITTIVYNTVMQQWMNYSQQFLEKESPERTKQLEMALLTLKILRKITLIKDCSKDPESVKFLTLILKQIIPVLNSLPYFQQNKINEADKYLLWLVKILAEVLEFRPYCYVPMIRPTLECCVTLCFNTMFIDYICERVRIRCLNLIKSILVCQEYIPAKNIEDTKNLLTREAYQIKIDFFSYPVLKEIMEQLMTRFFLLSEADITIWESSPEEFASEESGESWKFSLRPCTEVFFIKLFHDFRSLLTPLLVEMTKDVQNNGTRDFMGILRKDAIYNAVGLTAFDLKDEVDFDNWFTNVLIFELTIKDPGYFIIRRRVIWLIGQWVGVKLSPEMRPLLYEVILQLLQNEDNLIVRLAAATTLKVAVGDFEFSPEQFQPFLESSITAIFVLLKGVQKTEVKMATFDVANIIIQCMGIYIKPYTESLISCLGQLWASSRLHNLLLYAILSCLVHLVKRHGTLSESLLEFLLPMIEYSTDVSQPPHVYLLENGLNLWQSVLDNSSECNEPLLKLPVNLMPLLEHHGANLPICYQITEAYIILSPENFLKRYGQTLVQTFLSTLPDMKSHAINMVLKVVDTAFIVLPKDGPVLFQPILPFVLNQALQKDVLPISLSIYISTLARVIMHNQSCFGSVLQTTANESQKDVGVILGEFLDVWLEKMPLVFNPIHINELSAMALTCLLTSNSDVVHERICGIFVVIVETLNDITEYENALASADTLVITGDISQQDEEMETEQDKRKRELNKKDPVNTIMLRNYLYNQVLVLQQRVGINKFKDLLSTVDAETMQQLQKYMNA